MAWLPLAPEWNRWCSVSWPTGSEIEHAADPLSSCSPKEPTRGKCSGNAPGRSAVPPSGRRSVDWLNLLWHRKSLLLLGAVVGGVIGALVYFQKAPVYQSRSQVMVIKKSPGPVSGQGADPRMSFYEDYLSTHLVLIKSPIIVQKAVEKHRLGELPSFQGKGDPSGAILAGLTTIRDTSSQANNILNLSYSGAASEDCAVVLNAIINSYKDFLDEAYKNVSDDTLGQITRTTESFQKNLEVKEKLYAEFRKNSPLIYTKGTEGVNTQDDLLTQIHLKRLALIMRRAELQGASKPSRRPRRRAAAGRSCWPR